MGAKHEGGSMMDDLFQEPSLSEVLDEPITQLVMDRDGVDRHDLEEMLDRLRQHLRPEEDR
jgi:hypothetical protein